MRYLIALLLPILGMAAVWPEEFGAYKRVSAAPAAVEDRPVWDEYGLRDSETSTFEAGGKKFTATAYRLQDSTAAMAAFEWQRPADAQPSKLAKMSAAGKDGVLLVHGNYLLVVQGYKPSPEEMAAVVEKLPRAAETPLPPDYLPSRDLVANSERYVLGPAGLARFSPGIPPAVAAFRFGVEAQVASYIAPGGPIRMTIFNYPTPQIAMQQYEAFSKLPGAMAKRSGPLIAVVLSPANPDSAEHLLSLVRYEAEITLSERIPTRKDNIGDLIINIFELTGLLLLFSLVSGLAFGGVRAFLRRGPKGQEADAMIVLHLEDR